MKFKKVSYKRYMGMLEILPPAEMTGNGFLVGEPWNHRMCSVMKEVEPAYAPFFEVGRNYYEGSEAMTVAEFHAFPVESLKPKKPS